MEYSLMFLAGWLLGMLTTVLMIPVWGWAERYLWRKHVSESANDLLAEREFTEASEK